MFDHSSFGGLFPLLITTQASSNFVPLLNWTSLVPTPVVPPSAHVCVAPDVAVQPVGVPLAKVAKALPPGPVVPWKQFQSAPLVVAGGTTAASSVMLPSPDSKPLGV